MKPIKKSVQPSLYFIAVLFLVFSFNSCAQKIVFNNSTVVPAAQGKVKVKKDNNNNFVVSVNIIHLTDPSRLQPSKTTYVVWMETKDNGIKNIGQINSSSSLLSSTLKGSLTTVTPFSPTKIFITAENDGNIQHPGDQTILSTNSF
jgi:hypothetical protein